MPTLQAWFKGLSKREQGLVLTGAVLALLILLLGALLPLERRVASTGQRVATKQADLAWMQSVAPQLAALRSAAPVRNGESLVSLTDRVARETGLGRSLVSQPAGDGALSVRLEQVSFDALAAWIGALTEQHGVKVMSANIESTAAAGMVSATVVLRAL